MAFIDNFAKNIFNKELYSALMRGEEDKVIQLCQQVLEGPFHIVTLQNDTVLHMATYAKQKELVFKFLKELPQNQFGKLTHQNAIGNTILHYAATSDRLIPVVKEVLLCNPKLLTMFNHHGETPLLRAAKYGCDKMFEFLDDEINRTVTNEADRRAFHVRNDKNTILHVTVSAEHFRTALLIVKRYEYLVSERNRDGMTGLQLLALNPSPFRSWGRKGYIRRLIYSCFLTDDTRTKEASCRVPLWEAIRKKKRRYESALQLAKFLIERDASWEATESSFGPTPTAHHYRVSSTTPQGQGEGQTAPPSQGISTAVTADTPLILATKTGCTEIVEEILRVYPQAVEHVDVKGRNILHVAILYRQIQVFDIVENMQIPMTRLTGKIDKEGNTILHMVGLKEEDRGAKDMRSPALVLQEDLLLFERVRRFHRTQFIMHLNCKGQTAERIFADENATLRQDAKEWLKRTAENCSIVAVLVATVAFAAAYTVPGGPNETTGYPILLSQPFFIIFTTADVLSLTFALTSVITFLSILTSSFRLEDFKQSLPRKLVLGFTLLIFSVSMMMFSFAATVILMIRKKQQWTQIALSSVAFLPVTIFAFSYLPLYLSLMKTFNHTLKKIGEVFPRCETVEKPKPTIPPNPIQSQATTSTSPSTPQTTRHPI